MKLFKSIQTKLTLFSGLCILLTVGGVVVFSATSMRSQAHKAASYQSTQAARTEASKVLLVLEEARGVARSLAQTLGAVKDPEVALNIGRDEANSILRATLNQNPQLAATYTCWEPDAFDALDMGYENATGHDASGRLLPYWSRTKTGVVALAPWTGSGQNKNPNAYEQCRTAKTEQLVDPHYYLVQGEDELVLSVIAPIIVNETFYGIAGVDIRTDQFQVMADEIDLFDGNASMTIFSNNGTLCGKTKNPEQIGKNVRTVFKNTGNGEGDLNSLLSSVQAGELLTKVSGGFLRSYAPINVGDIKTPWSVEVEVPVEIVMAASNAAVRNQIVIGLILLTLALSIMYFIARNMARPIKNIAVIFESLSTGDVDQEVSVTSDDEIGILQKSSQSLINYIRNIADVARRIAENDLTVSVTQNSDKDILARSFNTMVANLRKIISQLADNASVLTSAAGQLTTNADSVSEGASNQSNQMLQISASIEEMVATVQETAKNASDANEGALAASRTATSGGEIVAQTVSDMTDISKIVRDAGGSISKLSESADQIGSIIGVIDDIADQTNLLALNAAIEAARAGEQGRGFAVVADEVRKLAERSGKATGEISDMIKGIQVETEEAVVSMKSGIERVDGGRELADKAGTSLKEIVSMSDQVLRMIQQIAAASEQQSVAASEIGHTVGNLTEISQTSANSAQQMATATQQLNIQAEDLNRIVAEFRME